MYKKGRYDIQALAPLAIIFVTTAIIIGFGAKVIGELGDTLYDSTVNATQSTAYNVTQYGTESLSTFGEWLPTLAIVVVAAVIIAVVAGAFFIGRR